MRRKIRCDGESWIFFLHFLGTKQGLKPSSLKSQKNWLVIMNSVERQCFYEIWIVLWLVIMNSAENEEVEADISPPKALFSSKKFCKLDTVALSFVFDRYCPIME